jgi:hypothetical protein
MYPGRDAGDLRGGQVGERRHAAGRTVGYDRGYLSGVHFAQGCGTHQRGRAIAAPGVLSMAAGAGCVDLLKHARFFGGREGRSGARRILRDGVYPGCGT